MQYVVPQFIEVESKVIGPISVRQFIILLATAGIMFIWYSIFSIVVFLILSVITFAIGGTFAFIRINGQAFHVFALSLFQTLKRPNLSVWRRDIHQVVVTKMSRKDRKKIDDNKPFTPKPNVSDSHIAELSLIVDTSGQYSTADLERLRQEQAIEQNQPLEPKR